MYKWDNPTSRPMVTSKNESLREMRPVETVVHPGFPEKYTQTIKIAGVGNAPSAQGKPKKLLERARDVIRLKHYSIRTEKAYLGWMYRYIIFHQKRHPKDMGAPEIEAFLTYLAVEGNVAGSTQNQAFNAILFLYRHVLEISLQDEKINAFRARKKTNLPVVLTKEEVKRVITAMSGQHQLMAKILYGSGLRLLECV